VKKVEMKGGAGREVGFHCIQLEPRNHTLNLGRAAYDEILIFIWGRLLRGKFLCYYWEGCMRSTQFKAGAHLNSITYKKSVRTSKRTPHFTIRKINLLMTFKKITTV
jgi:hypothetical protein